MIFGTAQPQSWGIIEGRSRGTTWASNYMGRSRGPTFSSIYRNVSAPPTAPSTPRSALKDMSNRDSNVQNVFSISFAETNKLNELQIPEEVMDEEMDENEEDFDNYQYFKERRFSIFPIP